MPGPASLVGFTRASLVADGGPTGAIRSFRLPLAASIVGHCGVAAILLLLAGNPPPVPSPLAQNSIEILLVPSESAAEPPPPEPPPPAAAAEPPPEPPPPGAAAEPPPPPVTEAEPPQPIVKTEPLPKPPPARPRTKPVAEQPARRGPPPTQMGRAELPPPAPVQTAAIPRPAAPAAAVVSAGYRTALGAWLESHKHYPASARERGEEGRAVLRFHVDRLGRVLSYAIIQSTGHPDLDAAIDRMMRGASLPPFPGDMAASDIEVSVTVRFALAR